MFKDRIATGSDSNGLGLLSVQMIVSVLCCAMCFGRDQVEARMPPIVGVTRKANWLTTRHVLDPLAQTLLFGGAS